MYIVIINLLYITKLIVLGSPTYITIFILLYISNIITFVIALIIANKKALKNYKKAYQKGSKELLFFIDTCKHKYIVILFFIFI